ncbi:hypothetical protein [Mesomycoplasma lagogenitalium]|uniref:Lipoprotein n=1 Tax=Mesomycoplasma lagogenitalium TaxID=171286 RepID=A0ABY8LUD6_9BACT|nr:hypothetical protein [Mesomycoplasma lagogenitalium]WGI36847.1 hypothetical protein QEG99_01010 [Mesomycoplasma lagogenitalium]
MKLKKKVIFNAIIVASLLTTSYTIVSCNKEKGNEQTNTVEIGSNSNTLELNKKEILNFDAKQSYDWINKINFVLWMKKQQDQTFLPKIEQVLKKDFIFSKQNDYTIDNSYDKYLYLLKLVSSQSDKTDLPTWEKILNLNISELNLWENKMQLIDFISKNPNDKLPTRKVILEMNDTDVKNMIARLELWNLILKEEDKGKLPDLDKVLSMNIFESNSTKQTVFSWFYTIKLLNLIESQEDKADLPTRENVLQNIETNYQTHIDLYIKLELLKLYKQINDNGNYPSKSEVLEYRNNDAIEEYQNNLFSLLKDNKKLFLSNFRNFIKYNEGTSKIDYNKIILNKIENDSKFIKLLDSIYKYYRYDYSNKNANILNFLLILINDSLQNNDLIKKDYIIDALEYLMENNLKIPEKILVSQNITPAIYLQKIGQILSITNKLENKNDLPKITEILDLEEHLMDELINKLILLNLVSQLKDKNDIPLTNEILKMNESNVEKWNRIVLILLNWEKINDKSNLPSRTEIINKENSVDQINIMKLLSKIESFDKKEELPDKNQVLKFNSKEINEWISKLDLLNLLKENNFVLKNDK